MTSTQLVALLEAVAPDTEIRISDETYSRGWNTIEDYAAFEYHVTSAQDGSPVRCVILRRGQVIRAA